jgi:hypothetical protein
MKRKKPAASRQKLNFAVDREEIEINSDWVQAVMGPPVQEPAAGLFFGPGKNTATDEGSATGEVSKAVAQGAAGVKVATGALLATGTDIATEAPCPPVVHSSPVALSATAVELASDAMTTTVDKSAGVAIQTSVEGPTTGVFYSTAARPATRIARPRPLRRVTDGLTGGQYAVYSLMLDSAAPGQGSRVYRGGYADLCRLTGLSKRGIQNVIAGLLEKRAIALSQAPGHHRTQTSVYEVHPPEAVVAGWHARGFRFSFGKSKTLSSTVANFATVA